tara:strand:+ start:1570 stop:1782 length:213 start_codon:yes stop_codon:yes gene_type:complete
MSRKLSQKQQILQLLKEGTAVNPMLALHKFGCFRLAAVIHELRADYTIITRLIEAHTGTKYAEYSLKESA